MDDEAGRLINSSPTSDHGRPLRTLAQTLHHDPTLQRAVTAKHHGSQYRPEGKSRYCFVRKDSMHPRCRQITLRSGERSAFYDLDINAQRLSSKDGPSTKPTLVKHKANRKKNAKLLPAHPVLKLYLRPSTTTHHERTATGLVTHLGSVHPHTSWLALIPQRIGHYPAVDHAITALSQALKYNKGGRLDLVVARAAYKSYGKALQCLRQDLLSTDGRAISDGPLITTAALAIVEITIKDLNPGRQRDTLAHWSGLSAILLARPPEYGMSDVARAIMYSLSNELIGISMATNTVSPFDHERWQMLDPVTLHSIPDDLLTLRRRAHQLIFAAPRFMKELRAIREGDMTDLKGPARLAAFAEEKLKLRDGAAETSLLRRIKARQVAPLLSQTALLPYDFTFDSTDDFEAGITYWTYSMGLINCCLELLRLQPEQATSTLDLSKLMAENDRIFTNIIMSWHYAVSLGPFAMVMAAKALLMHWRHIRSAQTWRGIDSKKVIEWILPRLVTDLNPWRVSAAYMVQFDAAAEMLVGGPLRGYLTLRQEKAQKWEPQTGTR